MTEATTDLGMRTIVVDGVTKYAVSFGLTDENGQPLTDRMGKPRFTNLVADTIEQLVEKLSIANQEVSRALARSSKRFETLNRTPTPAPARTEIKPKPLTAEETQQIGLDAQDPRKAAAAIQRVVESVVPTKELTAAVQSTQQSVDLEQRKRIAKEFIANTPDYLPVEANNAMLNQYLIANKLAFTVENLEFAFAACAHKLAQPAAAHNDPPPSPGPDNAPPHNEPNPGSSSAQPRRAPTGGIRNTQVSDRPGGAGLPYTREQLLTMAMKHDPKYTELIRDPVKNAMVNQILAGR